MELLAGQREDEDDAVVARLASCSTCREQLAELRRTAALVALHPGEQEELLRESRAPVEGEEAVVARFRSLVHAQRAPSAARPVPRLLPIGRIAVAALLLIGATVALWTLREPPSQPTDLPPIELDAAAFADAVPSGAQATRVDRFSWRESGVPSRAWQVELLAAEPERGAGADPPFLVSPRLIEPEWRPSAAEAATLPTSFRWRIVAEDARGQQRRSAALAVTQPPSADRGR